MTLAVALPAGPLVLLRVSNLWHLFGRLHACEDVSFTLGPGGVYRFRALEQLYQADARAVGDEHPRVA